MEIKRQKIPVVLKLKRLKNSRSVASLNNFISGIKPPKKYSGIPKRILLFRNDRIGDAVVTLPVIRDIKLNYPEMIVDVLVSPANKFLFEDIVYIDNLIEIELADNYSRGVYKIPLIGGLLLFLKFLLFPFIFSPDFRKKLHSLRMAKYDVTADLVGLKRNALVAGYVSGFSIGPGRLAAFLFYDYYSSSNWVSAADNDFMTRKIENILTDALGLQMTIRDENLPLFQISTIDEEPNSKEFEIIFHFGTGILRRFSYEKEKELVESFADHKILITDSLETESFVKLREFFKGKSNITFRIYPSLKKMVKDCINSALLVCYDGGQSHFLAQYIRTAAIFGPGSSALWKPYEFKNYDMMETDLNGAKAIVSTGKFRHIAFHKPMWCNPCFDTGCESRPCLNELSVEFISNVINKYCLTNAG